ncbi:MAG: PQQ-dependent sugar dehydrogenase [Vicinamibacterales bacterium]
MRSAVVIRVVSAFVALLAWWEPGGLLDAQSVPQQAPAMSPAAKGIGQDEVPQRTEPPATKFSYPTGPETYVPLPKGVQVFDTKEYRVRVVPVVNGLSRPFSMAFLPGGEILVTERTGTLRIVRNGVLDPKPIGGVPAVVARPYEGLQDIALHPDFGNNRWVYLTYTKPGPGGSAAQALARGRLDGHALADVRDLYVVDTWIERSKAPTLGSRIAFGKDGLLYMAIASPISVQAQAQNPATALGKVLRLKDDGTPAPGNPFAGREGHRPEIFTIGHRNPLGLAVHPVTGDVYQSENGPQGGDELNILRAGKNYGWPIASQGRDYGGQYIPSHFEVPNVEPPFMHWIPAIAISGTMFYTGDAFPKWKGNAFVGSLSYNHLERLTFNARGEPTGGREWLLSELKQRIRDIRQGPDGNLYVLTDAAFGALLRIERAD